MVSSQERTHSDDHVWISEAEKAELNFFLLLFFWKDSAKQIEAERWENAQRGVWHHSYTFEWYSVKCSKRKNPLEWESPCSNV